MELFDKIVNKAKGLAEESAKETARLTELYRKKASETWDSLSQATSETYNSAIDTLTDTWNNKVPSKQDIAEWAENAYSYITSLSRDFDSDKMWEKISSSAAQAGQEAVVMVLTIYYTITESISKKNETK